MTEIHRDIYSVPNVILRLYIDIYACFTTFMIRKIIKKKILFTNQIQVNDKKQYFLYS